MLTDKEKKQRARYEKELRWPAWKFIFINGVLIWGVPVALMVSLIDMFLFGKSFHTILSRELWLNLVGFSIGGIFYGWFMLRFIRKQYQKLKEKESLPG